jgi:hypothetical protein
MKMKTTCSSEKGGINLPGEMGVSSTTRNDEKCIQNLSENRKETDHLRSVREGMNE